MGKCPDCGEKLVFAAVVGGGSWLPTWICDCRIEDQELAQMIVEARELDQSLVIPLGSRSVVRSAHAYLN